MRSLGCRPSEGIDFSQRKPRCPLIEPKATVFLKAGFGGYMVTQSRDEILDHILDPSRQGQNAFVKLQAITFEGHEMTISLCVSEIAAVLDLPPDRWQFELENFMARRNAEQTQQEMMANMGGMGKAMQREIEGDD